MSINCCCLWPFCLLYSGIKNQGALTICNKCQANAGSLSLSLSLIAYLVCACGALWRDWHVTSFGFHAAWLLRALYRPALATGWADLTFAYLGQMDRQMDKLTGPSWLMLGSLRRKVCSGCNELCFELLQDTEGMGSGGSKRQAKTIDKLRVVRLPKSS